MDFSRWTREKSIIAPTVKKYRVGNETWYAIKCGGSSVQIHVNLTLNISSYKTISHDSPSQTAQIFSREQNTTSAFTPTNFAAIGV